jgi:hypothetical protein
MTTPARLIPFRRRRAAGALLAALLAAGPVAAHGAAAAAAREAPAAPAAAGRAAPRPAAKAERKLGIRLSALRLTAAGYMVDVRYRVTDPARARRFVDRKSRELFLVDEASGMRLAVPNTPKLGTLRQRPKGELRTDRDYFVMFANPGRHLQRGDRVTLVAGDMRIAHLAVE